MSTVVLTVDDRQISVSPEKLTAREWREVRSLVGAATTKEVVDRAQALDLDVFCAIGAVMLGRDGEDVAAAFDELLDSVTLEGLREGANPTMPGSRETA